MMQWEKLLSARRLGSEKIPDGIAETRSEFQRDYDRIIFSSAFRRLQNKTQVFPLPGSVFVHNRLTHSLEVASIGRSLANKLFMQLPKLELGIDKEYFLGIDYLVATACLAHDLGNPPFGHSGEAAISRYFTHGAGSAFQGKVDEMSWTDLIHFEGNANAFRLLSHQFNGRREGGMAMTYAVLASIVKYPYGSDSFTKGKYGLFCSEKEVFSSIANELGLIKKSDAPLIYARHPLVYLVEAADDIAYQVMDVEDAHRLNILSTAETEDIYLSFFEDEIFIQKKDQIYQQVTDVNERISFLRASLINYLTDLAILVFIENYQKIMNGNFSNSLVSCFKGKASDAMKKCKEISFEKIYNHRSVIEIELAGYNVLGGLLNEFLGALLEPTSHYARKVMALIPVQYKPHSNDLSSQVRGVLDYISGMTDVYALKLFQDIKGIRF